MKKALVTKLSLLAVVTLMTSPVLGKKPEAIPFNSKIDNAISEQQSLRNSLLELYSEKTHAAHSDSSKILGQDRQRVQDLLDLELKWDQAPAVASEEPSLPSRDPSSLIL